jgi:hypothetical protein
LISKEFLDDRPLEFRSGHLIFGQIVGTKEGDFLIGLFSGYEAVVGKPTPKSVPSRSKRQIPFARGPPIL